MNNSPGNILGLAMGDAPGAPYESGTAATSCPAALHIAFRHLHEPLSDMMRFIIECKGGVDTIRAMAGALWGIVNGAANLLLVELEARARQAQVAERL